MLGEIVVVCVLIWVLVQRWQRKGMVRLSHVLGTTKRLKLPFVGHAYLFLGTDEDRMTAFQNLGREAIDNGGITTIWQGHRLYLVIADPIHAEFVLKNCLEKDDTMKCLRALTGNGSIFAPVSIWRPRRKILAPTFSPRNLQHFVAIFSRQSRVMADRLAGQAGRGAFSIWNYITTYSMDSVCESTLGVRVNAQQQWEQPLLAAFEQSARLDSARLCQPWLHHDHVYRLTRAGHKHAKSRAVILDFVNQIIKNKRRALEEDKDSKAESDQNANESGLKTFLELLIESSGGYSDVELREETLVLVLAGTDTSAVGAAFTTLMLAHHPHVQDTVYQELREVFGDSERPVMGSDLPRLKYLEAVVRETLRLYPSVPLVVRKVDKEITLPSGVSLVKECGLVINIWALHRNPQYWGHDADLFRPERFLRDQPAHNPAYMPFSCGPRACIGYQYAMLAMKTALAALLRRYRLLPPAAPTAPTAPVAPTAPREQPLRVKFDVMMKHVDNFTVQLEARQ